MPSSAYIRKGVPLAAFVVNSIPGTRRCIVFCMIANINFDLAGLRRSPCPSPFPISTGSVMPYAVSYLPVSPSCSPPIPSRSAFMMEIT
eukprot:995545-Pleurochrysis_carterae.AAC.1